MVFEGDTFGWPTDRLDEIPPGEYQVQAVFHRYETFDRQDGHSVDLPASWEAGQQWNREPGNLIGAPANLRIDPSAGGRVTVTVDQVIPPIDPPEDTEYVRHVKIRSRTAV